MITSSHWYVFIPTNWRLGEPDKKKNPKKTPAAGRLRVHGLGRYLQGREGRARWSTPSNQRTERWTASRSRAFTAQILVQTWLFDCWDDMANISIHTFTRGVRLGGLPPALAPCTPATTKDCDTYYLIEVIEAANATVLPRGTHI